MITAIVQFPLPEPLTPEEAAEVFRSTAAIYRGLPGLVRKVYLLSEDGRTAGGAYLWESREAAERAYDAAWRRRVVERYGAEGDVVPTALTDYVKARKFYDYNQHSRVGATHGEFVTDEICDRFCVLGTVEQATAKLKELEAVGVDQFNIYLMTHGQEETLEAYGRDIIPQFSGVAA